ncbi:hypothetical protein [Amycolatopsis sp. cmx-11-51]|uniref:hypothetical protein n=1 Tax=unclassified Amycolatopsis TaxID=2618356 RepID=UPI0039E30089
MTTSSVPETIGGKNRIILANGFAMSRPNTPDAIMIIGLTTMNVAPATTGSRMPKSLPIPSAGIGVAIPAAAEDANRPGGPRLGP